MSDDDRLVKQISDTLPFLRRYARALTGGQVTGDRYAAATLEAVLEDASVLRAGASPRLALFRAFHAIWKSAGAPVASDEDGLKEAVQKRLASLTGGSREVLLLHSLERFPLSEVAEIMDISRDEAEERLQIARQEMADAISGRVLVIEDEAIIAMDLEAIVADLGHRITGVASTAGRAVELAALERPDLVLADVHLADGSSGIDAVAAILKAAGDIPVIFITAYPERLLTGERPEPAFLITKPYSEETVRTAIGQAMFFASTETLGETG